MRDGQLDIQISSLVTLISEVCVILECEGEFSIAKVVGRLDGMIAPLKEESEGEKALVEGDHDLGIRVLRRWCERSAFCQT